MFAKRSGSLESIVGDGTRVAGQINVAGTIRVDGIVEGDIAADWVVVGETGKIIGNTRTRVMVVGGTVEGNIEAAESVELSGKSTTVGEVRTPKLTVCEGAIFDGHARMKGEASLSEGAERNVRALNAAG